MLSSVWRLCWTVGVGITAIAFVFLWMMRNLRAFVLMVASASLGSGAMRSTTAWCLVYPLIPYCGIILLQLWAAACKGCKELVPEGAMVHVLDLHGIVFCKFTLDFLKPDCQVAAETLIILSLFDLINSLEGQPNLLAGDWDVVWFEVHFFVLCIFVVVACKASETCLSEIMKEWL